MRILMLTNTYLPHVGGVARSVAAFANEFRRLGHEVLIVAPTFAGQSEHEEGVVRVPALQKFNGSDFSVRLPAPGILTAALQNFQPQIVHAHHPFLLGDTAARIAAEWDIPLVFTHHTMYEQYTHYVPGNAELLGQFVKELTTGYTEFCDAVIVPSASVGAILRDRGVSVPLVEIPTGVAVEQFAAGEGSKVRRELGIPPQAFVVGHVGRLAPEKNLPFLAQAVARFIRQHRQAHFLVVGAGPSEGEIRAAFGRGLASRLHFAGVRSGTDLADAYQAMDVFAFASRSETQGMVLTEAMAAGLPVVGIDANGVREVIQDGVNGRLLPTENQRTFAAALTWVARQPGSGREQLRAAARQTAERFSLSHTAAQALALYRDLIDKRTTRNPQDDNAWEAALRRVEVEWELWSSLADAARSAIDSPHFFRVPVLGTVVHGWGIIRRWFSRTEWGMRLLKLPRRAPSAERGLILIQIDGLSRTQLERALHTRRMPFLRRLLNREGYRLQTHYSGIPSTTAAVLGELFYGVRTAVPAFAFGWKDQGRIVNMLDPATAAQVQRRLARDRVGLLEGGAAFCDPYTGGAAEAHCCAASLGWSDLLHYANPWGIALFLFSHGGKFLRALGLALIELALALLDCLRGAVAPRQMLRELKFIPSRVGVCVLLRELSVIGAGMAAARGVPVIQLNLLGYDEQSHHRGPGSRFAHWSLKAIDRAIRQVWTEAHHSTVRDYAVWVYSDHGQEQTREYPTVTGRYIEDVVEESFRQFLHANETATEPPALSRAARASRDPGQGEHSGRWRYLRRARAPAVPSEQAGNGQPSAAGTKTVMTVAVGPVGHVYVPDDIAWDSIDAACRHLVTEEQVPLILAAIPAETTPGQTVRAWTAAGEFALPRDAQQLLGPDHPFLEEAAADLVRLCQHPQAGDLVLLGWRAGCEPLSFAPEAGAHGGAGPEETRGFALLPSEVEPPGETDHWRPAELRKAALRFLGRAPTQRATRRNKPRGAIRLATYNVHSCVGLDSRLSPERIARVLAQCDADIVALQELDVGRLRTRGIDQAHEIARRLEMQFHFHPAITVEEERYGDAILSRLPMRLVRAQALPGPTKPSLDAEPRGALWCEIDAAGVKLQVINTHLGLLPDERLRQVQALLGPEWLAHPDCGRPLVLCGDFNFRPSTAAYRQLTSKLQDAQKALNGHRPRNTWFSKYPLARIDHVFVCERVEVVRVDVPRNLLTSLASDHLPVVVDFQIR